MTFYTGSDVAKIILSIVFLLIGIFLYPLFFMLIWNWIIPAVCGFTIITYWQAFFIGLMVRLINGSIGIKSRLDNRE